MSASILNCVLSYILYHPDNLSSICGSYCVFRSPLNSERSVFVSKELPCVTITLSGVVTVSPNHPAVGVMLRGGGSKRKLACRSITRFMGRKSAFWMSFHIQNARILITLFVASYHIYEFYAPGWLHKVNVQSTILRFPSGAGKLFKYQFSGGLSSPDGEDCTTHLQD